MAESGAGPLGAGTELGPYRLGEMLGTGGMGTVYVADVTGRAPGIETGSRVALKIVHPHLLETPGFFKRFLREGEIGQSVDHENVVRTLDCDQLVVGGRANAYLVMEYVEGQTLRDLLEELDRVPEQLCRHVGREIAKGLAAIHEVGVVHRDLKPENVLITEDHVVKVMDLGVARLQDEAVRLSQTGAFVGSIHYAAPEQFGGGREIDHRADLHALGLLLYELACGQHPYYDEDFRVVLKRLLHEEPRRIAEINPQLSPFLEEVIHTLIAKEREERFGTATDLADILDAGEASEWWQERAKALRIETKQPLRRIRIVRETALYGRDEELAKLHALFEQAKAGEGRVLLLEGEAGIGKTRLVDEFVGRLRQAGEDLNFLFGSYPPTGAATAAGGFSTAFREHLGPAGSAPYLTETPILARAFDAVLHGDAAPRDAEPLTNDSLGTCFVHATRALAEERTTVLLIDDLHFASDDARGLFTALALAVAAHRVLLIGTLRPGVPEEWLANLTRLDHTQQFSLSRLGHKDLGGLLKDVFRSERLAEELGYRIGVKSDGNPFFAFEIIRGLREGQFIAQNDDGTWVSTQAIDEIEIPASVMDLIQARISDLSEEEKELLDVASCCGFEFDPGLVARALGTRNVRALRSFGGIEKSHRLVRSAGRRMVFDHHQVQEALYAGLIEQLREEYHAALALALETREQVAEREPTDLDGALCVDLCEHYFKGARAECAHRYLGAALDHLETGYLSAQAIALADRALAVPNLVTGEQRIDLLLRKASRLGHLGQRERQLEALEDAEAAESTSHHPPTGRVSAALGVHLKDTARFEDALIVLRAAQRQAESSGDTKLLAQALDTRGQALCRLGRTDEARAHHERAIALIGEERGAIAATGNLAIALWLLGRTGEAKEHARRTLELAREAGKRSDEANANGTLGIILSVEGLAAEARPHLERSLEISREIGYRKGEGVAAGNLGVFLLDGGRLQEARARILRSLEICREIGDRRSAAVALANVGLILSLAGDARAAMSRLAAALSLAQEIGAKREIGLALLRLGNHQARCGEGDAALGCLTKAVENAREIGTGEDLALSLLALGALMRVRGAASAGKGPLTEALETARAAAAPGPEVLARAHLTGLPGGDAEAALAALSEHEDTMSVRDAMEARFLLWKATSDAADLAKAHSLLQFQRDHAPEEYRDSMVENVPLHRGIAAAWAEHGPSSAADPPRE